MKKTFNYRRLSLSVIAVIAVAMVCVFSPITVDASGNVKAPGFPHVARASNTSLKLTWSKVDDATGYQIYRYDSKAKKY